MRVAQLVTLALVLVAVMPAHAGEPDPLSDARDHYERGMSRYQLGEFAQAIDEFKIAYAASRAPGLLFNLAQASRLAKQFEQALHFYRAYLRARPDAPNRADAEVRILELEPLVAAQHQREQDPAVAPGEPTTTPPSPVPPPPATLTPPPPTLVGEPTLLILPRNGKRERIASLVTGGVGLVALAIGIYFGTQTLDVQNQVARVGTWDASAQSLYGTGRGDAAAATTLYVAGGAAVATGTALYIWGWRRDLRARRFAVAPRAGGAHASVSWDF